VTGAIAVLRIPDDHTWLRVADTTWSDPLDPSWAATFGGRWNAAGSFPVLYVNEDLATARAQIHALLGGWPVNPEDLRDDAPYVLVLAGLPRRQDVADALSDQGLEAMGLPPSYPLDARGDRVPHQPCQMVGTRVHAARLRGVWCRSAATADGSGRELAWFPSGPRARARSLGDPMPFAQWWAAESVAALANDVEPAVLDAVP
jgi:hypothetical protein